MGMMDSAGRKVSSLADISPEALAKKFGFKTKFHDRGIGGEWIGPDTISVSNNKSAGKYTAGDWTGKETPDFSSTASYPENLRTAAHEIAHGLFTQNPEKAHTALKEIQALGVPKDVAFESLIDMGGLHLLEPQAIQNPKLRGILDGWLGDYGNTLKGVTGAGVLGAASLYSPQAAQAQQYRTMAESQALQEPTFDPTTLLAGPARLGGGMMNMGMDALMRYFSK